MSINRNEIQVGEFKISEKMSDNRGPEKEFYWIYRLDGEGMGVDAEKFENFIKAFYEVVF